MSAHRLAERQIRAEIAAGLFEIFRRLDVFPIGNMVCYRLENFRDECQSGCDIRRKFRIGQADV